MSTAILMCALFFAKVIDNAFCPRDYTRARWIHFCICHRTICGNRSRGSAVRRTSRDARSTPRSRARSVGPSDRV